jgi:hypothetical protein
MRLKNLPPSPLPGAALTTFRHVVAFYETDAMGIVHHSNYVRFLELARVQFMADHDQPYSAYVAGGCTSRSRAWRSAIGGPAASRTPSM